MSTLNQEPQTENQIIQMKTETQEIKNKNQDLHNERKPDNGTVHPTHRTNEGVKTHYKRQQKTHHESH